MKVFLVLLLFCHTLASDACSSSKMVQVIEIPQTVQNLTKFIGQHRKALIGSSEVEPEAIYNSLGRVVSQYEDINDGDALKDIEWWVPFHLQVLQPEWFAELHRPLGPVTLTSVSDVPHLLVERISAITAPLQASVLTAPWWPNGADNAQKLQRSAVGPEAYTEADDKQTSNVRTSSSAFDSESEVAVRLNRRAFDLLRVPYSELLEDGLQLLRYEQREAYIPHTDWFETGDTEQPHNFDPTTGGTNRFATVFLYLSDVEEGGQTVFPFVKPQAGALTEVPPEAAALFEPGQWEHEMVQNCYHNLSFRPRKATAIVFYSQAGNGALVEESLHGGCPVLKGIKWAANLWVWNGVRYGLSEPVQDENYRRSIDLLLVNRFRQPLQIWWQEQYLETIPAGERRDFSCYDGDELTGRLATSPEQVIYRRTCSPDYTHWNIPEPQEQQSDSTLPPGPPA